jgi:hypothetical protein
MDDRAIPGDIPRSVSVLYRPIPRHDLRGPVGSRQLRQIQLSLV